MVKVPLELDAAEFLLGELLVGALLVGALLVGALLVGALLVGALLVGALLVADLRSVSLRVVEVSRFGDGSIVRRIIFLPDDSATLLAPERESTEAVFFLPDGPLLLLLPPRLDPVPGRVARLPVLELLEPGLPIIVRPEVRPDDFAPPGRTFREFPRDESTAGLLPFEEPLDCVDDDLDLGLFAGGSPSDLEFRIRGLLPAFLDLEPFEVPDPLDGVAPVFLEFELPVSFLGIPTVRLESVAGRPSFLVLVVAGPGLAGLVPVARVPVARVPVLVEGDLPRDPRTTEGDVDGFSKTGRRVEGGNPVDLPLFFESVLVAESRPGLERPGPVLASFAKLRLSTDPVVDRGNELPEAPFRCRFPDFPLATSEFGLPFPRELSANLRASLARRELLPPRTSFATSALFEFRAAERLRPAFA